MSCIIIALIIQSVSITFTFSPPVTTPGWCLLDIATAALYSVASYLFLVHDLWNDATSCRLACRTPDPNSRHRHVMTTNPLRTALCFPIALSIRWTSTPVVEQQRLFVFSLSVANHWQILGLRLLVEAFRLLLVIDWLPLYLLTPVIPRAYGAST